MYSRNQFSPTMTSFLKLEEVDMEREVPVRTAAREESMGGGQGFQKCHCTGKCQTKRCKCKSLNMRCNSRLVCLLPILLLLFILLNLSLMPLILFFLNFFLNLLSLRCHNKISCPNID